MEVNFIGVFRGEGNAVLGWAAPSKASGTFSE